MYAVGALLWADRHRLRHAVARVRQRAPVRPRDRPARLAHGDRAGGARDGGCRDHRIDLLRAAAGHAAPHLADLPGRLCRVLHRRSRRQPAGRHRRVRHRDAARAGSLRERAAHRRRDRGVPALLLHHPAVPRRLPVHRQRDPAARRRPAAPGRAARGRWRAGANPTSPSPAPPGWSRCAA